MQHTLIHSSSRLRFAVVAAAAVLLSAATPVSRAQGAGGVEVPIISLDEKVQKELMNLDRLLETDPKLEETLRTNLDQINQQSFRVAHPSVDALLKKQPGLANALKTERHFFIHRYVARLAANKVTRKDAIALDDFLRANPDIAKALAKRPAQMIEQNFLIAHPSLGKFFETHPALSSVLLQRAEKKQTPKAKK